LAKDTDRKVGSSDQSELFSPSLDSCKYYPTVKRVEQFTIIFKYIQNES